MAGHHAVSSSTAMKHPTQTQDCLSLARYNQTSGVARPTNAAATKFARMMQGHASVLGDTFR